MGLGHGHCGFDPLKYFNNILSLSQRLNQVILGQGLRGFDPLLYFNNILNLS